VTMTELFLSIRHAAKLVAGPAAVWNEIDRFTR
jgi:hypothetical protein